MAVGVKVKTFGNWDGAASALNWLQMGLDRALKHAMKEEAKHITKSIKDNLRKGGQPAFKPITSFTRAVRRAMGIQGRRSGVATKQVLNAIVATKVGKHTYFCGVLRGNDAHISSRGDTRDVADVAMMLETGRPKFFLELDRPGKSGKTPRQWLWWLYFSGAIKNPPGFKKTHLEIGAAPSRPFVGQVADRESLKIPKRISDRLEKRFVQIIGSL